jgi:hypothetical protein
MTKSDSPASNVHASTAELENKKRELRQQVDKPSFGASGVAQYIGGGIASGMLTAIASEAIALASAKKSREVIGKTLDQEIKPTTLLFAKKDLRDTISAIAKEGEEAVTRLTSENKIHIPAEVENKEIVNSAKRLGYSRYAGYAGAALGAFAGAQAVSNSIKKNRSEQAGKELDHVQRLIDERNSQAASEEKGRERM